MKRWYQYFAFFTNSIPALGATCIYASICTKSIHFVNVVVVFCTFTQQWWSSKPSLGEMRAARHVLNSLDCQDAQSTYIVYEISGLLGVFSVGSTSNFVHLSNRVEDKLGQPAGTYVRRRSTNIFANEKLPCITSERASERAIQLPFSADYYYKEYHYEYLYIYILSI